jgi:electron transfer flavoprotein alpha subunit
MPRKPKGIKPPEVVSDKCIGCQICVGECPVGAIEMSPEGVAEIDPNLCIACGKCVEACPVEAIKWEKRPPVRKTPPPPRPKLPPHRGVAVFLEVSDGTLAEVSRELVGKARELATKLNAPVLGLLLGHKVEDLAAEAIHYGCDEVHLIDHPLLEYYRSKTYGEALSSLCRKLKPEILLLGATPLGRDLSPVVATLLRTGLTADCTGLDIEEDSGVLLMTRPTFGGNIMATIFCRQHRPQMSTVRPRVFRRPQSAPERQGPVTPHKWKVPSGPLPTRLRIIRRDTSPHAVDITRSPALVVAGKGACSPEALPMLEELARVVGGVVACSRPVVESGLMPYERQVGQTGKTVAPKLYIGVGVSGAVQHLVGMQGSERIVAINSDPNAPIFKVADVGIVGDYREVVPELVKELKSRNTQKG